MQAKALRIFTLPKKKFSAYVLCPIFRPTIRLHLKPSKLLLKTLFTATAFTTAFKTFTTAGFKCQMKFSKTISCFPLWLLGHTQPKMMYQEIYSFKILFLF